MSYEINRVATGRRRSFWVLPPPPFLHPLPLLPSSFIPRPHLAPCSYYSVLFFPQSEACRCQRRRRRPQHRPTAWRRRSPRCSKRSSPSTGDAPQIRTSLWPSIAKIARCWSVGARSWFTRRATSDRRMSLCRR